MSYYNSNNSYHNNYNYHDGGYMSSSSAVSHNRNYNQQQRSSNDSYNGNHHGYRSDEDYFYNSNNGNVRQDYGMNISRNTNTSKPSRPPLYNNPNVSRRTTSYSSTNNNTNGSVQSGGLRNSYHSAVIVDDSNSISASYSCHSRTSSNNSVHYDLTNAIDDDDHFNISNMMVLSSPPPLPVSTTHHSQQSYGSKPPTPTGTKRIVNATTKDESYYVAPTEIMDFAEVCLIDDSYPTLPNLMVDDEDDNNHHRHKYNNTITTEDDNVRVLAMITPSPFRESSAKKEKISNKAAAPIVRSPSGTRVSSPVQCVITPDESFITDSYVGDSAGDDVDADAMEQDSNDHQTNNAENVVATEVNPTNSTEGYSIDNEDLTDDDDDDEDDDDEEDGGDEENGSDDDDLLLDELLNNNNPKATNKKASKKEVEYKIPTDVTTSVQKGKLPTIPSVSYHTGSSSSNPSATNGDSSMQGSHSNSFAKHHSTVICTSGSHTVISDCSPRGMLDDEPSLAANEIIMYDHNPWQRSQFNDTNSSRNNHHTTTILIPESVISPINTTTKINNAANPYGRYYNNRGDDDSSNSTVSSIQPDDDETRNTGKNRDVNLNLVALSDKVKDTFSTPFKSPPMLVSSSTLSQNTEISFPDDNLDGSNGNGTSTARKTDLLIEREQYKLERHRLLETIENLRQMVCVKNDEIEVISDQLRRAVMTQCDLVMASAELDELKGSMNAAAAANATPGIDVQELKKQNYTLLEEYSVKEKELLTELITLSNKMKDMESKTKEQIEEMDRKHRNVVLEKDFVIAQLTVELQTSKMKYSALKEQLHNDGGATTKNNGEGKNKSNRVKKKTNIKKIFHTQ